MRTREDHGIEVSAGSGVPAARAPRRRRVVIVVAALVAGLLAAVVTTVGLVRAGGDDDVVAKAPPAAPAPGPAPLEISVEAPTTVVAGEPADLTVSWTDGTGVFSGSTEEWGDAVATSSRKQGRCEVGAAPAPPAEGTYALRHTWNEPGTYEVVLRVATSTCESGTAVEEEAGRTVTVEVLPAG